MKVEFASVTGPALTVTAVAVDSGMTTPPETSTLPAARRGCTVPDEHSVTTIETDSLAAALLAEGENTHPVAVPTWLMSLAVSPEIAWLNERPNVSVVAVVGVDGDVHVAFAS
ncbi:unannotated protein [freshwater metagenome]|uniref:Unannotated protein n=1 Tax=freshwater metagenome TaxID=449393 RepID=A0A6J6EBU5_9ZZZZ